MNKHIDVIFENHEIIAINKPHGLLVHRSKMAADAKEFALQLVRNYVGKRVYPVHRLDRKTSGVLIFAKSKPTNSALQEIFRNRQVKKNYIGIVRGFVDDAGVIDYPIAEKEKLKDAVTSFRTLRRYEIPIPSGNFKTSRYSLIDIHPETGRFHQIRKHMAHIFHPIIGDRPHGCNKQNKLWKTHFEMNTMLLHASRACFNYSSEGEISIEAPPSQEFNRVLKLLNEINTDLDQGLK